MIQHDIETSPPPLHSVRHVAKAARSRAAQQHQESAKCEACSTQHGKTPCVNKAWCYSHYLRHRLQESTMATAPPSTLLEWHQQNANPYTTRSEILASFSLDGNPAPAPAALRVMAESVSHPL